jgi:hypothetical protein
VAIPFDIAFGFGAGSIIALSAKGPLVRTHEPMRTRYFAVAALFGGAAMTPSGLTFYAVAPDWSLMYLANPAHLSNALMVPIMIALYVGAPVAGFLTTHRLMRFERTLYLRAMLASVVALILFILLAGAHRILTVAYYDAFHLGQEAIPIYRSRLALALPLASIAIGSLLAVCVVHVRRHVILTEDVPLEGVAQPRLAERLSMETSEVVPPA